MVHCLRLTSEKEYPVSGIESSYEERYRRNWDRNMRGRVYGDLFSSFLVHVQLICDLVIILFV